MVWLHHNPEHYSFLYGDDGEMQCPACMLDFKRNSLQEIEARWQEQAMMKLALDVQAGGTVCVCGHMARHHRAVGCCVAENGHSTCACSAVKFEPRAKGHFLTQASEKTDEEKPQIIVSKLNSWP